MFLLFSALVSDNVICVGTVQRKKIETSEITMEAGGWVQVSHGFFLENHPKIALLKPVLICGVVYHMYSVCIYIVKSC